MDTELKQLWEAVGFQQKELRQADGEGFSYDLHWRYGDYDSYEIPAPDLNNFFKWIAPELFKRGFNIHTSSHGKDLQEVQIEKNGIIRHGNITPLLEDALYQTAWEVLNGQ